MTWVNTCPFCAFDTPILAPVSMFSTYKVICPDCDCSGPERMSQIDAIAAWNHRASDRFIVTPAGKAALRGDG